MTILEPTQGSAGLSAHEIRLARECVKTLQTKRGSFDGPLILQGSGESLSLPSSMTGILDACLSIIGQGHLVAVMPIDEELGTQEAADLLGVSRPYLVKLLDTNALPSRKVGVQRRVRIDDLRAYKERERAARIKILVELAAEDQRLKLGE